jgi:hypothetical protein
MVLNHLDGWQVKGNHLAWVLSRLSVWVLCGEKKGPGPLFTLSCWNLGVPMDRTVWAQGPWGTPWNAFIFETLVCFDLLYVQNGRLMLQIRSSSLCSLRWTGWLKVLYYCHCMGQGRAFPPWAGEPLATMVTTSMSLPLMLDVQPEPFLGEVPG